MILGLQIIALVFVMVMLYFSYLHYRRGEINGVEMMFWLLAWAGAVLIVIFPELFRAFSRTVSVSRAFDLAVLGGFMLVIPLVYLAYVRTRRLEKKIEELIRIDAQSRIKRKK